MTCALDTNVLIRYIVRDDKTQTQKATTFIESLDQDNPAFISCIVLCEINWVLKTAYAVLKEERVKVLDHLFSIGVFEIENLTACLRALRSYQAGPADFADYLIHFVSSAHGYDEVLTFDKKALKSKGFRSLGHPN